ncbi:hypothetical protein SLS59_003770 [Nothophoma quercina]|uniref:Lytic polysaccharide monooxygenase n=1 Tax=Nothophoma quercina TaxID=749835 RepID=A0ABR3RJG5_9PLEO
MPATTMPKTALFAAMLAMASTTSAHMFIASPVPFDKTDKPPITAANFPCQARFDVVSMNDWSVGQDVSVTFPKGQSAVHGGGSCQISVTKDEKPTASSKWKVIHSVEGGCMTTSSGNLADNGEAQANPINFKVPSELPEGKLTMAWTWFNKVGNREMYMNCAPVNVAGGTGKGFDDLPDMATANIGGTCTTKEGNDYTFANPGKSVEKLGTGPYTELCGGAASEGGSTGGSGSTGDSGSTGGSGSTAPAASASPAAPQTPATTPAPTTPQAPATGGGASGGSSCSENGAIVCNGESQFGICSNGQVVYQAVAEGTKCSGGKIARRDALLHRNQRTAI